MRIPFDLIAAVLCMDGIRRCLEANPEAGLFGPPSLGLVLSAWGGFILCVWLGHELLARRIEWRTRCGLRPAGVDGGRHPLVSFNWGLRVLQVCTVAGFAGLLWLLEWPLWMQTWPQWLGWAPGASLGHLTLAHSTLAAMLLNLLPFLLAMVAAWIPRRRLARGFGRPPVPLGAFLLNEMRLTWLPLLLWLLLAIGSDGAQLFPRGALAWLDFPGADFLTLLLFLVCMTCVVLPRLVVWFWRCRPLPEGELRTRLLQLMAASKVKARDVLLWGPRNSNLLNACVLGPWAPFRYVLISPQLAEALPPEETEAVLAHELGHARYGHLSLLFVMLLCMAALLIWISQGLAQAGSAPFLDTGISILFITLYIWGFFGAVMRQCEREADLASAELLGSPQPLIGALERLALLHGESRHVYSWHHGSIAQRVNTLQSLCADPQASARLHTRLRRTRVLLTILTVLALSAHFFLAI